MNNSEEVQLPHGNPPEDHVLQFRERPSNSWGSGFPWPQSPMTVKPVEVADGDGGGPDDQESESHAIWRIQTSRGNPYKTFSDPDYEFGCLAYRMVDCWQQAFTPYYSGNFGWFDGWKEWDGCWRKNAMAVAFAPGKDNGVTVYFYDPHYTSDTNLKYGPWKPQNGIEVGDVESYVNRNNSDESQLVKIAKSFEIAQSVGSEFKQDFSFDTTVSSESKVTAGGEEFGGSFEQTLTLTFGSHFGQEETETKELSETRTDAIELELDQPAGKVYFFLFSNAPVTAERDFDVNGYLDWKIDLELNSLGYTWWANTQGHGGAWGYDKNSLNWDPNFQEESRWNYYNRAWANSGNPGYNARWSYVDSGKIRYVRFSFENMEDFASMFTGDSEKWPMMADESRDLSNPENWRTDPDGHARDSGLLSVRVKEMADPERRKIVLKGTQTHDSKTAMTLSVYDITDLTDDQVDEMRNRADDGKPVDGDGGILTDPATGERYAALQHVKTRKATRA